MPVNAGAGYWLGWTGGANSVRVTEDRIADLFRDGPEAARAWATLARQNDLPGTLKVCTGNAVRQYHGRTACTMTLWVDGLKVP